MNRIDSLLLLHRRLDGDHDDEQTAASTMPATSVVDGAADSPLDSISTLNSVHEEEEDDNEHHHSDHCEEGGSSEAEEYDSDLVVGFPSVPRRSSEALGEEENDDETTNTGPASRRSSLRSSSSCSLQHKTVRFVLPQEDPVAIHYIESVLDMSPQEISKLWITAAERAKINQRNRDTVKSMRRSSSENDLNHLGQSSRGLEHLQSSRILRALAQSQRDLIEAVLHLQSTQRKNSSFHPHRREQEEAFARDLALLARQMSQSARARAIEIAEADAATAALIAAMDLQEGQAISADTGATPIGNDRRRRYSDVTLLPSIPQERPSDYLPTIGPASAVRIPTTSSNHAATRQAYLANLQETLELSVYDDAGDNQSVASTIHGATSVGSQDSPLCF